ncbi:MAG: amino acid ABC transporter substrate-binding protein [Magnetococcus sp. WYHC-3]
MLIVPLPPWQLWGSTMVVLRLLPVTLLFWILTGLCPARLDAADAVRVRGSLGLTGAYAPMAHMQLRGYTLWADQVNAAGGLLGRPVDLKIVDDGGLPERARAHYAQLIQRQEADLYLAPYSSTLTGIVAPLLEAAGYPVLASGAADDQLWSAETRYLFGLFTPASRYAVGFLELMALNGIESVAVVGANDRFSRTLASGAKQWAGEFGLKVVFHQEFTKDTDKVDELVQAVRSSGAQAVVVCGHYKESVVVKRALDASAGPALPFFATVGPAMDRYGEDMGAAAQGVFSSSQWEVGIPHHPQDLTRFVVPFRERHGVDPSYHAADAYATGQILAAAVERVRSLDPARLREVLSQGTFMSVIGRYGVDAQGRQVKHFPITVQWQDGQRRVVWPEALAGGAKPLIIKEGNL